MHGLAAVVQEQLKADPFSGTIYCFRSKRADRVKLVFWDDTGLCLFCKRLEDGKFRWPRVQDGVMRLSAAQLSALLEGLDWSRVHARRVCRRKPCSDLQSIESSLRKCIAFSRECALIRVCARRPIRFRTILRAVIRRGNLGAD
jgi:transposase